MARQPEPWKTLRDEIRKIQDQIRRMQAASPFFGTGFHPTAANGIESDDFDGDLDAGDAGSKGWAFNSARAAIGELFLRPGSLSNDYLTSPVVPGVARNAATGFSLTAGTLVEKVALDLIVPDGTTRLLCTAAARLYALNPNTTGGSNGSGGDALYVSIRLGSSTATVATPTGLSGSGGFATTSTDESYSLTGLIPGSTLRLSVLCASGYANLAANTDNRASFSATLLWLR